MIGAPGRSARSPLRYNTPTMRRLVLAAVLLLATVLLATQFGRIADFAAVLRQGDARWLGLAFAVQALWQVNQAAQFLAAHRAVGVRLRFSAVLPPVLVNNFALLAVPSGSLSTFALFAANAQRRGFSPARAGVAVMVFAVVTYLVLAIFALTAAGVLAQRGQLNWVVGLPVLGVTAVAVGQYAALLLAAFAPARFERAAAQVVDGLNRLAGQVIHRDLLPAARLSALMAEAAEGLAALRQGGWPAHLAPFGLALTGKLAQCLLFALVLRAFGQAASLEVVVAGVSLAALFSVVSPTPLGVGVAEGALALVLTLFGQPLETALVVALAYRALSVWWPFVYGFVTLQLTGLRLLRGPAP